MFPAPAPAGKQAITYLVEAGWLPVFNGLIALATKPLYWQDDPNADHALQIATNAIYTARVNMFVGAIVSYCGSVPTGILPCDGTSYNRADYPQLWEQLPTALKTPTSFVTPDLRERFIYGAPDPSYHLTEGGEAEHTLTEAEMPSHSHANPPHSHGYSYPSVGIDLEGAGVPDVTGLGNPPATFFTGADSISIQATGGGLPHNNLPPYVMLGFGIVAL